MGGEAGEIEGRVEGGESLMLGLVGLIVPLGLIFWLAPKRRAIWLAILTYAVSVSLSILSVFIDLMQTVTETGEGDPELVAGAISQMMVKEALAAVLFLPVLVITYIFIKRRRTKAHQGRSQNSSVVESEVE